MGLEVVVGAGDSCMHAIARLLSEVGAWTPERVRGE
jgi:hypothetical protein